MEIDLMKINIENCSKKSDIDDINKKRVHSNYESWTDKYCYRKISKSL